jgi:hypothetical protein
VPGPIYILTTKDGYVGNQLAENGLEFITGNTPDFNRALMVFVQCQTDGTFTLTTQSAASVVAATWSSLSEGSGTSLYIYQQHEEDEVFINDNGDVIETGNDIIATNIPADATVVNNSFYFQFKAPVDPTFTLQLVKANGSGTLNVGVVFWANQTILVCLHPDIQPAKFKFIPGPNGTQYLQIYQTAFDSSHFPPAFSSATLSDTPLYIRTGPPNYGGEQEGYTYVTTNLADATAWTVHQQNENAFKLSMSIKSGPYSYTRFLRSDDSGFNLNLNASDISNASIWQAV